MIAHCVLVFNCSLQEHRGKQKCSKSVAKMHMNANKIVIFKYSSHFSYYDQFK